MIAPKICRAITGIREMLAPLPPRAPLRRADLTIDRAGRNLALGVSVSPLVDVRDAAVGRVIDFQDLTELRRMEDQVQRTERSATVGQLAAGVAHEIRNPLASISGSIELSARAARSATTIPP